jgi:hypothetical protein
MGQLDASVRNLVALYLAESIPVDRLADDLPDGWELDEEQDATTSDLTLRVMGYLAEFQRGDLDESSLRRALMPFAAWTVQTSVGSFSAFVNLSPQYEEHVSLGADTEPQEVPA